LRAEESKNKLRAAGANIVESPTRWAPSGWLSGLRPTVTSFLGIRFFPNPKDIMEGLAVSERLRARPCQAEGLRHPAEIQLIIIAIKKADGTMPSTVLRVRPDAR
jgi:hypothetical protein